MPSFGLGLSLGSSQPKKSFDPDAWAYISANNIPNSQEIRNYSSGKSLLLQSGGNSNFSLSTDNQASLGSSSPFVTTSTKSWTLGFWLAPQQFIANTNSITLFVKNNAGNGTFEWDSSLYATSTNLNELYFRVSSSNNWSGIDNWAVPYTNASTTNGLGLNFSNKKTLVLFEWDGPTLTRRIILNSAGNSEAIYTRTMATSPSYSNYGELNLGRNENSKSLVMDEICAWSRVLTSSERQELFNLGDGRTYSELSSGLKTNLVSWWGCSETSGNRADSHGSNTFVQGGTTINSAQPLIGVSEYVNPQTLINKFIVDCKSIGVWANGVFYPLRKGFAGTSGVTIYPFGGYNSSFNGTLVSDLGSGTASSGGASTAFSNHPTQFTSSGMLFLPFYGTTDTQQLGLRINLPNNCVPSGTADVSIFAVAMPYWKETGGVRDASQFSHTRQRWISSGDGNTSTDNIDIGIYYNNEGNAGASWSGFVEKSLSSKANQLLPRFDVVNATTSPSIEYYQNASLVGTDTTLTAGYSRSGNQNRIGFGGTSAGGYAGSNAYIPIAGFFNKTLTSTEITNLYNTLKSTLAYGFNLP